MAAGLQHKLGRSITRVLASVGFKRLLSRSVAFYHSERDLVGVVRGDDFVFVGVDRDLDFVLRVLKENYELKDRGRLGSGDHDTREVDMGQEDPVA